MFSENQSVSYYNKNRNAKKAGDDIFLGKKAEYAALYALVKHFNFPETEIDLEIRKNNKKKWIKDLIFGKGYPDTHVKSCSKSSYEYCGQYSWLFQLKNKYDNYGKDEIFSSDDSDLVVFVYIDDMYSPDATIKAIAPWGKVKLALKDPMKKTYHGIKKALYLPDLIT